MKSIVTRRKTCRLCDHSELEVGLPLAPTPVAEKYVTREQLDEPTDLFPLDVYMCLNCGHVQLLDVIDAKSLFEEFTYASAGTKALVQNFEDTAELTCSRYRLPSDGLVVDIGSNDGSLLKCFQKRGHRVLGVDPATAVARQAIAAGVPTLIDFLNAELAATIVREHGKAAVVCAFNVYAHADDLAGMTDNIRSLLRPDGLFVFEVSYLLDVLEKMLLGTIFHEHLSYHSMKPLKNFLQRHGLELIDVQRNAVQGGSIVGTAQLIGGPHPVSLNVQEIIDLETAVQLDQLETLKAFGKRLLEVKDKLSGMVVDFKNKGKSIWGYGAARSGTTLISQMNLGRIISAIVDDNPEKQNKFSPGDHIPILPTSALYDEKPDYAFILAWIHAQRIIENNQAYLQQGGKFIVCFPEIKIIGIE